MPKKADILSKLGIDVAKVKQDFAALRDQPATPARGAMQMPSLSVVELTGIDVQPTDRDRTEIILRLAVDPNEVDAGGFQPKWARLNDRPLEDLRVDVEAERLVHRRDRIMREVVLRARGNEDSEFRLSRSPLFTIQGGLEDGRRFSGVMIPGRAR